MKPITIVSLILMSTYLPYVKRFYQTNIANGELWKHKSGYLAAAVIGYIALHTMCGCTSPPEQARPLPVTGIERQYAPSLEMRVGFSDDKPPPAFK